MRLPPWVVGGTGVVLRSDVTQALPHRGLPDSPSDLLRFIQEVHAHYLHQRPLHTPVVVHCR